MPMNVPVIVPLEVGAVVEDAPATFDVKLRTCCDAAVTADAAVIDADMVMARARGPAIADATVSAGAIKKPAVSVAAATDAPARAKENPSPTARGPLIAEATDIEAASKTPCINGLVKWEVTVKSGNSIFPKSLICASKPVTPPGNIDGWPIGAFRL